MSSVSQNKTATREMDPISWMRGVKIRKRSSPPTGTVEAIDDISLADPKATQWEQFDSLGEEVTTVLGKFPNVDIKTVSSAFRPVRRQLTVLD